MRRFPCVLLVLIFLCGAVPRSFAEAGPYIGGGVQSTSFAGDLRRGYLVEVRPNVGPALALGWRFSSRLSLAARVGRAVHKEILSSSNVTYTWMEVGPEVTFRPGSKLRPLVFAGAGSYDVETTGLDFSGRGFYAGAGLEERAGQNDQHAVRLTVQGCSWKDDTYDLEVETFNAGLTYHYLF